MAQIHKEYERYFLLEPTKLNRLIDAIHQRFDELPDRQVVTVHDSFAVFLKDRTRVELTNVDEVLNLDNSDKRKIQRLLIVCSASTAGAVRPEHEVEVDFPSFESPKPTAPSGARTSKKAAVTIRVRSDTRRWATRTLSEVEEQVERTWQRYNQPVLWLLGIVFLSLFVLLFLILPLERRDDFRGMWLKGSDLEHVDALVQGQRIITDQELREVFTRQLRNVLEYERPQQPTGLGIRQLLLIAIPLAVVVALALVLTFTCYPRAVFLWGDEERRYASMLRRRTFLWSLIGGVLFVSLLSKSLQEGVIPWISH